MGEPRNDRDRAIADVEAIAGGNHNAFTTRQAVAFGLTREQLLHQARPGRGRWRDEGYGVWSVKGTDGGLFHRCAVTLLGAGPGVVLGPVASCALSQIDVDWDATPDLIAPPSAGGRRPRLRRRALPAEATTSADGLRCLVPIWALTLLAEEVSDIAWEWALESALHRDLVTVGGIEAVVGHPSTLTKQARLRIGRVLALRPPGAAPCESRLEVGFVQMYRTDPDLPALERQVEIRDRRGVILARIDFVIKGRRLYIDVDGALHDQQRPQDRARTRKIATARSLAHVEYRADDIWDRPRATMRQLRLLIEAAAAA